MSSILAYNNEQESDLLSNINIQQLESLTDDDFQNELTSLLTTFNQSSVTSVESNHQIDFTNTGQDQINYVEYDSAIDDSSPATVDFDEIFDLPTLNLSENNKNLNQ